jgi:hypothetical protein
MTQETEVRFNSWQDYDAFLNGDRTKAVPRFVFKNGLPRGNREYAIAPYGLILSTRAIGPKLLALRLNRRTV